MESTVTSGDTNWTVHPEGQCNPLPTPHLGTFKLVTGNGTSVGTVMTLVCPYKHRAISGGRISCVQEGNITEWIGGIPECKLVTNLEGVRLALLLSVISTAIILLMSGMLFTSLLLKCLRKEEMRHLERVRRKETDRLWPQINVEEQRQSFYTHNGGFNNNNNNIQNSRCNNRQQQQPRDHEKNYPDPPPLAAYFGINAPITAL